MVILFLCFARVDKGGVEPGRKDQDDSRRAVRTEVSARHGQRVQLRDVP